MYHESPLALREAGGEPGFLGRTCARPCRRTPEASRVGPERAEQSQAILRGSLHVLVTLAVLVGVVSAATAQEFPTKAVRVIAPFAPGGATDALATLVSQKLSDRWRHQVIVDDCPGAAVARGIREVRASGSREVVESREGIRHEGRLTARLPLARWQPGHAGCVNQIVNQNVNQFFNQFT